jgi:hypothetical protein
MSKTTDHGAYYAPILVLISHSGAVNQDPCGITSGFTTLVNHSGPYSPIISRKQTLRQKTRHSLYQRPHRLATPEM